jgi:predicted MFS family arabinose efflux permease
MLPLALFRSRDFAGANLLTLFLYGALGGTLFFVPLNLVQVQRYSATAAGAALLPFILIMFLLSRWSGGLVQRYGARLPLVVGPMVAAIALFALPGTNARYWNTFFPAMVVLGLGMALSVAPLTTTVMNAVPPNRVGSASGINNAVSRTAGLLAVAVFGIVMLHEFNNSLDAHLSRVTVPAAVRESVNSQRTRLAGVILPREMKPVLRQTLEQVIDDSFLKGFRAVMLTGAALAFLSGAVAYRLIGGTTSPRALGKRV